MKENDIWNAMRKIEPDKPFYKEIEQSGNWNTRGWKLDNVAGEKYCPPATIKSVQLKDLSD